jgi:hypothetical protein
MARTVTVLWLVLAVTIVAFALNAAHFSAWEFIIPVAQPWTWLAPLALFSPPLLLLVSKVVSNRHARGLVWVALLLLCLPVVGFLALIIFPKQTGYYDPDDPARQPSNVQAETSAR